MPFKTKSAVLLFAASLVVAFQLEANTSFTVDGDSITVDDCKSSFDKGNFIVNGKPYSLVVPEYKQFGLDYGMKLDVDALEFGYAPEAWGITPAYRIILERDGFEAKKCTSRSYIRDDNHTMVSQDGASVPRLIYKFDDAQITVGEVYKISFLDADGNPMDHVRYAVCEMDDALCIFSDLRFTVNNVRYVPVYALKLKKPSDEPPAPPPPPPEPKPAKVDKPERHVERAQKPKREAPPKPHIVNIAINQPTKVGQVTQDDDQSYHGFYYDRNVEVKSSTYQYSGKLSCSASPREETEIVLEAYFVVRDISKGAKDRIAGNTVIGTFQFGGKNPKTQPIQFITPTYEETKVRKSYSGYYAGRSESERSGVRFRGVILRALENGDVRKVVSMPSSQDWDKIGKKQIVTFDTF